MIETGIYKITCLATNKIYVGQTGRSFAQRWREEKKELRHNISELVKLQRAWNKYGEENFKFEIVELVHRNKGLLCEREQYWMDYFNSVKDGFNCCPTSNSPLGIKRTEETITRMKLTHVGFSGRSHSIESNQKNRESKLGVARSSETKEKIRLSKLGRKRKPFTKETKKKMSESGYRREETKRNNNKLNLGR